MSGALGERALPRRGRPALNRYQRAGRVRAARARKAAWLEQRLDKYVAKAESLKKGSKGRAWWYQMADDVREKLRAVSH